MNMADLNNKEEAGGGGGGGGGDKGVVVVAVCVCVWKGVGGVKHCLLHKKISWNWFYPGKPVFWTKELLCTIPTEISRLWCTCIPCSMCVCVCVCARARLRVCERVCVCARACVRVMNRLYPDNLLNSMRLLQLYIL